VAFGVLAVDVVDIVGGDEADAELGGEGGELRVDLFLLRQAVVLELDEEAPGAEDVDIFAGQGLGAGRVATQQQGGHLAGQATAEGDEALAVFAEKLFVDARLVVEAFGVGAGDELHEVAVACVVFGEQHEMVVGFAFDGGFFVTRAGRDVDFAADDRFDAGLDGVFVKVDDAAHGAVVGDGDGRHAELFGAGDEPADPAGAVEETELGVVVEVDEGYVHSLFPFGGWGKAICRVPQDFVDVGQLGNVVQFDPDHFALFVEDDVGPLGEAFDVAEQSVVRRHLAVRPEVGKQPYVGDLQLLGPGVLQG
jgi:hypothetical protein